MRWRVMAAGFEASKGRDWRPLVDTTNQPTISQRRPVSWVSWQRAGGLLHGGAAGVAGCGHEDSRAERREEVAGRFCEAVLTASTTAALSRTRTRFEDIVAALNQVQPYDWTTFLRERVYELHPEVPENGFTQGGYKLIYNDTPFRRGNDAGGRRIRGLGRALRLAGFQRDGGRDAGRRGVGQRGVQGGPRAGHAAAGGERRGLFGGQAAGRDPESGERTAIRSRCW